MQPTITIVQPLFTRAQTQSYSTDYAPFLYQTQYRIIGPSFRPRCNCNPPDYAPLLYQTSIGSSTLHSGSDTTVTNLITRKMYTQPWYTNHLSLRERHNCNQLDYVPIHNNSPLHYASCLYRNLIQKYQLSILSNSLERLSQSPFTNNE